MCIYVTIYKELSEVEMACPAESVSADAMSIYFNPPALELDQD